MTLTEVLKEAIRRDGRSWSELDRATGVDRGSILRFMQGKHSLLLSGADKLCEALKLELRPIRRPAKRKG